MADLKIEVIEIKGKCPVYIKGEEFYIVDGYKLKTNKAICMHSLASILPYYIALSKEISPKVLGLSKNNINAYIQCLDPCEYTGGGSVIFKISKFAEKES